MCIYCVNSPSSQDVPCDHYEDIAKTLLSVLVRQRKVKEDPKERVQWDTGEYMG